MSRGQPRNGEHTQRGPGAGEYWSKNRAIADSPVPDPARGLEGLAASLATARIDAAGRKKLQSAVATMRRCAKSKDLVGMFAGDKEFHETIWNLAGNPFLTKALNRLLLPYFGFLAASGYYAHLDDLETVPRVHQEVLNALTSENGDQARRVLVAVHSKEAGRWVGFYRQNHKDPTAARAKSTSRKSASRQSKAGKLRSRAPRTP